MKTYKDKDTGFVINIEDTRILIDMPIKNLVMGFNNNPNNYYQNDKSIATIKKGKENDFANWLVKNMLDDIEAETGDNYLADMLTNIFSRAIEGDEDFCEYNLD
jgi:predicted N-formylglutamate amidohydrolase